MGRKPLSDDRKFDRLVIMLTETERNEIKAAAVQSGLAESTWARELLLAAARLSIAVSEKRSEPPGE
jgi:hypothetical protein